MKKKHMNIKLSLEIIHHSFLSKFIVEQTKPGETKQFTASSVKRTKQVLLWSIELLQK